MEKKNVLILGAGGKIARHVIEMLLKKKNYHLTLYLRRAKRLSKVHDRNAEVIEGDVLNLRKLKETMEGQDLVYANLDGKMRKLAENIIKAMDNEGIKRLIFINSMGIYDEVPGKFGVWNKKM